MNINTARLALTFAGCFLGAGYVSGRELWQFFGNFGIFGIVGLVLSMTFIFVFGVLLMRLASMSKIIECDKLIIRADNKFLRTFIGIAETFFLVGIAVIMIAGVGALFRQTAGISEYLSCGIFSVLLFFLALGGHERMINVFSLTVPVLVFFTVLVGIVTVAKFGFPDFSVVSINAESEKNPLLSSWWVSSITYVCYNLFSSVQILAPVGAMVNSKKRLYFGVFFGSLALFLIAGCIFVSMSSVPFAYEAQLPMLFAASSISKLLGIIYSVLLFFGMLGTALSSLVAVIHFVISKTGKQSLKLPGTAVLCIIMFFASLVGFGDLIGTVYPICGYLGVFALLSICEHYFYFRKNGDKKS